MHLIERIAARKVKIGVIGLGYVGISVASALAGAGFEVTGVEIKQERVAKINAGKCPIDGIEPGLPELIAKVTSSKNLVASTDYASLADADVVLIDVETPVATDSRPRFEALRAACRELGRVMKEGVLVIVESTIAPGTCARIVVPLLEKASGRKVNEGFSLGHCPERVMPGKLLKNLKELSRVCGGSNAETSDAMVALYRTIVEGKLDKADCTTAEMVKTAENTYRDVNIAFANELGLICEAVGVDFRRVRDLVNESPGRDVHFAGAGVGGHCIPKDPWLLVHGIEGFEPKLIAAARARNDSMPLHMARLVESALEEIGKRIYGSTLAVLGYAYLENSDDTRNSPSEAIVEHLQDWGAKVLIHDPWVEPYTGDLWSRIQGADAAIIMVKHDGYQNLDLAKLKSVLASPVLVDGRHVVESADAAAAGFVFRGLGRGRPRYL
ncbi:MAG: nucleotide sugar dehydrogenase [Labilithrix sp.]|nr:nucleotide sugar dehydrogenase [Labilithrix sp.]